MATNAKSLEQHRSIVARVRSSYSDSQHKALLWSRMALTFLVTIFACSTASAAAATQTASIVDISDRSVATGGTASLTREADMFRIDVNAVGLTPGHAYYLLLVAFNNPLACKFDKFTHCEFNVDSNAQGGNPMVTSTSLYLTGGIADPNGTARFNGKLEKGAVGLAGREVLEGTGVYNMTGAQLQVVIRDMGPAGGGGVDAYGQTTKHGFGCDVNTCSNVQIVTFD